MRRCHYCGKILHELPYKCRRCGNIFCSDHHLPENHHCHGHHPYEHKPRHRYCGNCGKELTGMPYKCHRCGLILCDDCRLPENHGCEVKPVPPHGQIKSRINTRPLVNAWRRIREAITLKNFTILSIILMVIAFVPVIVPLDNYLALFGIIFLVGILCFLLAYFLYAVKCWGSDGQICAMLMLTLPLLAHFFATSAIPESTGNILFYLIMQFCFYAIISAVVLYASDKIKNGISRHLFRRGMRYSYFSPDLLSAVAGVVLVSFLVIMMGSPGLFSENLSMITGSWDTSGVSSSKTSASPAIPSTTPYQNPRIIPPLEPEIINSIDRAVGVSAPPIDIPALESRVHVLINQQRTSHGLPVLSYDSSLASIARRHSEDMARNNYFSHTNRQGLDPTGRGNQAGYSCYKDFGSYYTTGIAENIMQNNLYDSVTYYNGIPRYDWNTQDEIAQSTVSGWMGSPGHRQNILTSTYDREGIGVAIADDGKVYVTENFC